MMTHSSISEFNVSIEDWTSYTECLEQYFTMNDIGSNQAQAEQQWAILLAVCGPTTYHRIRSLTSPAKTSEKTYNQIRKLVQVYQQPTSSFIVQRFSCHNRVHQQGESMSDLWLSSRSSLNTVDLVTSWKICYVIAWSVAAETSSFNKLFWLNKNSH